MRNDPKYTGLYKILDNVHLMMYHVYMKHKSTVYEVKLVAK